MIASSKLHVIRNPKARRRKDDGLRGNAAKLGMSVMSALVVGAVGWLFTTALDLTNRVEHLEWWLRYKGLVP